MKSRYQIVGLALNLVLGASLNLPPVAAQAAPESIPQLAISATLAQSGSLDVIEDITYDFAGAQPHPLAHTIPTSYQDDQGRQFPLTFTLLESTTPAGPITITQTAAAGVVTLNLPATTPPHRYRLQYTLAPVVLSGPTADILKLPVTGSSWPVAITALTFTLSTPGLVPQNPTCYTGTGAATSANCTIVQSDSHKLTVTTTAPLPPGQTLSLYCNFPPATFAAYLQPTPHTVHWLDLMLWFGLLPALIMAGLIWLLHRRLKKSYILKAHEVSPNQPDQES